MEYWYNLDSIQFHKINNHQKYRQRKLKCNVTEAQKILIENSSILAKLAGPSNYEVELKTQNNMIET